jgi:hypothetical protein
MIVQQVTYGHGGYDPDADDGNIVSVVDVQMPDPDPAHVAAVTRWRGMGFTDEEIVGMYPHLSYAVDHSL